MTFIDWHEAAERSGAVTTPESAWDAAMRVQGEKLAVAIEALELVAASKRNDGSYNRCREACEQLALEALAKIRGE